MKIERIELHHIELPLVHPFRTSFGEERERPCILVAVYSEGLVGWGECVAGAGPWYSAETVTTAWHILTTYLAPMLAFLALVEIGRHLPPEQAWLALPLKVAVPLALFAVFAARRSYPELGGYPHGALGLALDVLVGLAGAALWVGPYLLWPGLRPEGGGFDPAQLGASMVALAWVLRGVGYGLVTPFVEELFVRSWLQRFADVWDDPDASFRDVPVGRFTPISLVVVVVYFTLSHAQWEWPVAAAWILATQLWFYYRRHLLALVVVHAASNLAILGLALARPDLRFFV